MPDIAEKLNALKGRWTGKEDMQLIKQWEKEMVQISKDEEYLNHENSKRIIKKLREAIDACNDHILNLKLVKPDDITALNGFLSRRTVYQVFLEMYGDKQTFKQRMKSIEQEVDSMTIEDQPMEYPKEYKSNSDDQF